MPFLAFKSQILEHYVVNSILPSLQFWFCLSKWLDLENNFWVPNYATGLRSAEVFGTKFCSPVPNPGLSQIQNQIRDGDSDLILNKTKSNTETQIWF